MSETMTRRSREESRNTTRERLLASAREQFGRVGYAPASIERIAEAAGYSKGAFYSNFPSKEAIFVDVLKSRGDEALDTVIAAIDAAVDDDAIMAALVKWAVTCSRSGGWSLTILEYGRATGGERADALTNILKGHWRRLGDAVVAKRPNIAEDAEILGTLLHEIAFAPAMTLVDHPTSGELMRMALTPMLERGAAHERRQPASENASGA